MSAISGDSGNYSGLVIGNKIDPRYETVMTPHQKELRNDYFKRIAYVVTGALGLIASAAAGVVALVNYQFVATLILSTSTPLLITGVALAALVVFGSLFAFYCAYSTDQHYKELQTRVDYDDPKVRARIDEGIWGTKAQVIDRDHSFEDIVDYALLGRNYKYYEKYQLALMTEPGRLMKKEIPSLDELNIENFEIDRSHLQEVITTGSDSIPDCELSADEIISFCEDAFNGRNGFEATNRGGNLVPVIPDVIIDGGYRKSKTGLLPILTRDLRGRLVWNLWHIKQKRVLKLIFKKFIERKAVLQNGSENEKKDYRNDVRVFLTRLSACIGHCADRFSAVVDDGYAEYVQRNIDHMKSLSIPYLVKTHLLEQRIRIRDNVITGLNGNHLANDHRYYRARLNPFFGIPLTQDPLCQQSSEYDYCAVQGKKEVLKERFFSQYTPKSMIDEFYTLLEQASNPEVHSNRKIMNFTKFSAWLTERYEIDVADKDEEEANYAKVFSDHEDSSYSKLRKEMITLMFEDFGLIKRKWD